MQILSSSFLPKASPVIMHLSLTKTKYNLQTNSCFNKFQPTKKLITHEGTRKQSLCGLILKPLHDLIRSFTNDSPHHLSPFFDPKCVLSGNFSPVDELPPTACVVVEGSIPSCLDGAYIQNRPNPQFTPRGPYHVVDGDGMLQANKISRGEAKFCARFIKTYKYTVERGMGYPVFPNLFAFLSRNLTGSMVFNLAQILICHFGAFINGVGTSNTSLAIFGKHLFALVEYDLPYAVKMTSDGDIITIGRHDFHTREFFMNMTAHPKVDPDTGEAFAFRYFVIPPFLTFFRIDSNGRKQNDVPIFSVKGASFIHDFAVTKNFAIFPDVQIVINPLELIVKGKRTMRVDHDKVPRLGVIPRYAEDESEMYWINVPGLNILHVVNSWEEDDGDTIVIVASNVVPIEHALERMDLIRFPLEEIKIDVKAKNVVMRRLVSDTSLDFGVINPKYAGKKNRYLYAAAMETMPKMAGAVKIDLSRLAADPGDCTVASRMYGPGCYGSQPIFVAREPENLAADEDDGYLLSYVHNENTHESHFLVMDARNRCYS